MLAEISALRHGERNLADQLVNAVLVPVENAITQSASAIVIEFQTLARAGSMAARNAALEQKIHQLAAANQRLKERAVENQELRRMLALAQSVPAKTIAANVVGYSPEGSRREIAIDRGWRDGARRDAVVINGDGLVGRIIDAGAHDAHVLLIIDPTSSIPAYLQQTRSWGIVTGTWQHVRMKYIGQDVKVQPGDTVVTGRGEIYPGGIPIGTVREIDRKDNALYQTAVLAPAVDFNALAHVLVFKKP